MIKKCFFAAIFAILFAIIPVTHAKLSTFAADINNEISVKAKSCYLMEYSTGGELISQNADEKLPIASMTKLATLAVIFNEIEKGNLSLEDMVSVSKNAADTEGSSAFLDAASEYSVDALIKTIIVVSANDSCVALAEKIAGSEELFAKKMNKLVDELKLNNTHFENATGLPSPNHYSSARDMAKIYAKVCNNETYKKYSKIWMEDFIHPSGRKTGLVNTNRLIKTYQGIESGKTGHTNEAKYCITASAKRGDMRLIAVVIGAETSKERFGEAAKMFNYGFANYAIKTIADTKIPVATADIRGAEEKQIKLSVSEPYTVLEKKGEEKQYSTKVSVNNKIVAPVEKGEKLGTLYILNENNIVVAERDLVAEESAPKKGYNKIIKTIIKAW